MKLINLNTDKNTIPALPRFAWSGPIFIIQSEREAARAARVMTKADIIGLDTETRPAFRHGEHYQVALLQMATREQCFLFRLCQMGLPQCIIRIFEDKDLLKVGLSLGDDWRALSKRAVVHPTNVVELQSLASRLGTEDMSLQKLYANLLGGRISKTAQLTNWEADTLSAAQVKYAATDAVACINLYDIMQRLVETRDYQLVVGEVHEQDEQRDEPHTAESSAALPIEEGSTPTPKKRHKSGRKTLAKSKLATKED